MTIERIIVIERLAALPVTADQVAADIDTLMLEVTEMIPAADLDGAGELDRRPNDSYRPFDNE